MNPKEFTESKVNSNSISLAHKQQEQLSYFTQSQLQKNITVGYLNQWAERNYVGNDYFLNWVKSVFKTDNFLSFFKYYRNPNASSKLIQNRIKEPLSRVFFSEDSYFNYSIKNKEVEQPQDIDKEFETELFEALLFNHNAIVIHDLKDVNEPFRKVLDIDKVISIESQKGKINRLAYCACAIVEDVEMDGYLYMDAERYIFFDKDFNEKLNIEHDLEECPAEYISPECFGKDDVVRKSIFSYVREELEEYTFLKTLQRMTEPNGAIPVVTYFKTKETDLSGKDAKGVNDKEPMSLKQLGGQVAELRKEVKSSGSHLQTGSIIGVETVKDANGRIDTDLAKNFINFFYLPTEALNYLKDRIKEIEQSIIISVLGDYSEANEDAKNEMQVAKSYVSKEDKLRWLSFALSKIREASDYKLLSLKYGKENVSVGIFYGSDFFLETEKDLNELFKTAPNSIERKNVLVRKAQSRNRFNKVKAMRDTILYKILPYAADVDFDKAIEQQAVDSQTFQLQTRFNYWIAQFEASYGDIVSFWEGAEVSEAEKLVMINNLINDLITKTVKNGTEKNRAS